MRFKIGWALASLFCLLSSLVNGYAAFLGGVMQGDINQLTISGSLTALICFACFLLFGITAIKGRNEEKK